MLVLAGLSPGSTAGAAAVAHAARSAVGHDTIAPWLRSEAVGSPLLCHSPGQWTSCQETGLHVA